MDEKVKITIENPEGGSERVWASVCGEKAARINNIPLTEGYDYGDIVEVGTFHHADLKPLVVGVVVKSGHRKLAVHYKDESDFHFICGVCRCLGVEAERHVTPRGDDKGVVALSALTDERLEAASALFSDHLVDQKEPE